MTPAERYEQGRALLPKWGDKGDDVDERHARAVAWIGEAAEAGHVDAIRDLAEGLGGDATVRWSLALAELGEVGSLVMALTNGDHPPEHGVRVLAAAREGVPWATLTVAEVYQLGLEDGETGEAVAKRDGAFGWLPGVADPDAEGLRWARRAAEGGWAPAALALAQALRFDAPEEALVHAKQALAAAHTLLPRHRTQVGKLVARLLDDVDASFAERIAAQEALAASGDHDAEAWLGDVHRDGDGVPVDLAAARAWYERAAAGASVDGLRELGRMCEEGVAGPVDLDRARALYEQAAELGADEHARDRLAERWGLTWYAREPRRRR